MLKTRLSKKLIDYIYVSLFILILFVFAGYESGKKIKSSTPDSNITTSDIYSENHILSADKG